MERLVQADLDIFNTLNSSSNILKISDFKNQNNRTLVVGFDSYNSHATGSMIVKITRHIYILEGKFHIHTYKSWNDTHFLQLEHYPTSYIELSEFLSAYGTIPSGTDKETAYKLFEHNVKMKYLEPNSSESFLGDKINDPFVALTHYEILHYLRPQKD